MASINKVILLGNVGKPPELRYSTKGNSFAQFSIATKKYTKKENGENQSETEWHQILAFGKIAELCSNYLSKGSLVYVEGRLQTKSFTTQTGILKTMPEILIDTVQMLSFPNSPTSERRIGPIISEELPQNEVVN